jgi:hypothetical protein
MNGERLTFDALQAIARGLGVRATAGHGIRAVAPRDYETPTADDQLDAAEWHKRNPGPKKCGPIRTPVRGKGGRDHL